jgi:hypothetical protein
MTNLRFIELTTSDFHTGDLNLLMVNINSIKYFMPCEDSEDTVIGFDSDCEFIVRQSVTEIKDLIRKAEQSSNVFQT